MSKKNLEELHQNAKQKAYAEKYDGNDRPTGFQCKHILSS